MAFNGTNEIKPFSKKIYLASPTMHGDLKIPANYVVNGVWLARWFSEQRAKLNGKPTLRGGKKPLTKDQKEKLRSLDTRRERVS